MYVIVHSAHSTVDLAIEVLLEADLTLIDAVDAYGRTALMLASMNGYLDTGLYMNYLK